MAERDHVDTTEQQGVVSELTQLDADPARSATRLDIRHFLAPPPNAHSRGLSPAVLRGMAGRLGNSRLQAIANRQQRSRPGRGAAAPMQRYAVGLEGDATTAQLVAWLNSSSPHSPAWAKTSVTFSWKRQLTAEPVPSEEEEGSESEGGTQEFTVTVLDTTVEAAVSVDMPEWTADSEPMQESWDNMCAELRAHEAEHERVAAEWKDTLTERLGNWERVVTAASSSAAVTMGLPLADSEWNEWIADHQAAQDELDNPQFYATLYEPAPPEEEEEAPEEEAIFLPPE